MRKKELTDALGDLHSMLVSKKTKFVLGPNGLQARHAHAMESHLQLVVKNGCGWAKVVKQAAETHGFAENLGGWQLWGWNQQWVKERILPVSCQGCHAKIDSLLNDPAISPKTSSSPLSADQYLKQIVHKEMPAGLKQYKELEFFPRIHLRVGSTMKTFSIFHIEKVCILMDTINPMCSNITMKNSCPQWWLFDTG